MGKYIKESNKPSELSEMVVDPHQKSHLFDGVLTRAKTQALKNLGLFPADSPAPEDGGSYIQLRSRRLERPVLGNKQKKRRGPTKTRPKARARVEGYGVQDKVDSGSGGIGSGQLAGEIQEEESVDLGSRDSVIAVALEGNGREQREGMPCSLPRGNVIRIPGLATRARNSTEDNGTVLDPVPVYPTQHDMDAFFTAAEERLRKQFIEKYNFDPANEQPLPGRYEWVKVDP